MKYEFEILDSDLEDRRRVIEMKEDLRRRIDSLSQFGQNTMAESLLRLKKDLEWCETEWLFCQRERAINKLSEVLNVERKDLGERYWREDD